MFNLFPTGVSVITLVIIRLVAGVPTISRKVRLGNSKVDFRSLGLGVNKDGSPVLGPACYRELTFAEMIASGMAVDKSHAKELRERFPLETCVSVCNTMPNPYAAPAAKVAPVVKTAKVKKAA